MDGDRTGAYARAGLTPYSAHCHPYPDSAWGVIDAHVDTDFPDIRCSAVLHSRDGTLGNIPREGDLVRFYIQLPDDTDFVDKQTGRVDRAKATPEELFEMAKKMFQPYHVEQVGQALWWTIYIGALTC